MSGSIDRNARAGIASLTVNGNPYDIASDAEYYANAFKRETLPGQGGIQGFKITATAGYISATIRDAGSLDTSTLNVSGASVILTLANGKVVQGDGMWATDFEGVKTEDGTFSVKYEGPIVYEDTV